MRKNIFTIFAFVSLLLVSCTDKFFEEAPPEHLYEDEVFNDIARAQEFLNPAYSGVRGEPWLTLEYSTDNAVFYDSISPSATSNASAELSPVAIIWDSSYKKILHINEFLQKGFDVPYNAEDSATSVDLKDRIRGEAYGLRAYYKWLLLKNFAGPSANNSGNMLGFPIIDDVNSLEQMNSVPRGTYMECYKNISNDLDSAFKYIKVRRYIGGGNVGGLKFTGRLSREVIYAIRARMALYAASEAYKQISWEAASDTIYSAIKYIDSDFIGPLEDYGMFDNLNNRDHFWRVAFTNSGTLEENNFPPSLFGKGECNPSQNLIDAFPDNRGYPIDNILGFYNRNTPYEIRDERLNRFVFHNDTNRLFRKAVVQTYIGGADASGGYRKKATRTGYYLKKYLNPTIDLDITSVNAKDSDIKVYPVFTRVGLYLDFAEAVTNAYGLTGQGPNMSADVTVQKALVEIRSRGRYVEDFYLVEEALGNLDLLKELIQNERRIEFAFEGERYYDVRRWMLPLDDLNQPIRGASITKMEDGSFEYDFNREVEPRAFTERMYYNPIPPVEIYKSNALIQNLGW